MTRSARDRRPAAIVDGHLRALGASLRGPRRARADLLAEARDGLLDATEAYERRGYDRRDAERRAVADFGTVAEVAAGYQTELGLAQSQRTAGLLVVVLATQPLVWERAWPTVAGITTWQPGPAFLLADQVVGWLAATAIAAGVLAVLACGPGVRYLGARPALPRATGVLALGVLGVFALGGLVLAVLSPAAGPLSSLTAALWWTTFLALPLGWIGLSARRCLAAAG